MRHDELFSIAEQKRAKHRTKSQIAKHACDRGDEDTT
jgi:hypothetical protein